MKRFVFSMAVTLLLAPCSFAIIDVNENGVSDFWEKQFNAGDLLPETFDSQADDDSDGWSNMQEAAAGTNPFNPNPPDGLVQPLTGHTPEVKSEPDEFGYSYIITPEAVTVSWPTLVGKQYTLLFSPDLSAGSWVPIGDAFIGTGSEVTYGFTINDSDKRFWRVAVCDVDSDDDGLNDHEEHHAGTNPKVADSDWDGLSDHAEIFSGSDPVNQDTDGDGIPDLIDTQPLANAQAFSDADGDGIPDANDPDPANARGPAPSFISETSTGNPIANFISGEQVRFVIAVSNPGGAMPTASDLTFYVNGAEESAAITVLNDAPPSTRRFLLTWNAETTEGYPARTVQNLTLRFRDADQATSWINLARIDVAEWEGVIAMAPVYYSSADNYSVSLQVESHVNGRKYRECFGNGHSGWVCNYRGPVSIPILNEDTSAVIATFHIPSGIKSPLFMTRFTAGGVMNNSTIEGGDYAAFPHNSIFIHNNSPSQVRFDWSGIVTDVPGNSTAIQDYGTAWGYAPIVLSWWRDGQMWPLASTSWAHGSPFSIYVSRNVLSCYDNDDNAQTAPRVSGVSNFFRLPASITPHMAGTPDVPGMPIHPLAIEKENTPFLVPSETFHHLVFRTDPVVENWTNGVKLRLARYNNGYLPPQEGINLYETAGGEPLSLDANGEILLSPTANSTLFQSLTSENGLTLLLKRDGTASEVHYLQIAFVSKFETGVESVSAGVKIVPVEIVSDMNNDGQITAADNPLREAAYASGATDEIKDKGTEFIFHNDNLSNGAWDKDDTDPARPATAKDDDDAEKIIIKPGITEGEVWLDHPAITQFSFYRNRECKAADKVNLSPTSKFSVSASNPFPDELFMRADGTLTYPEGNPQFEGDLVLKIKVGIAGQEIEAVKMKLAVVKEFGARKYFQAANDYVLENNAELFVHEKAYGTVFFRLCLMREEGTYILPFELYEPARDNWIQAGRVGNFSAYTYREAAGISEVMINDPNMTVVINGNQCGFTSGLSSAEAAAMSLLGDPQITDRCQGRLKELNATQSTVSNDHFDENTNIPGTQMKGSALAGPDPLPGTTPPQAGGKYVAQYTNGQISVGPNFAPDFSVPPDPSSMMIQMGGLSSSYTSSDRNNYNNSLVGNAPIGSSCKKMVFVIMGRNGEVGKGKAVDLYNSAVGSGVPLIPGATTPSGSLPPITMVFLDSGVTSCALAYKNPSGTLSLLYKGSKHNGMPYYTNTFLRFQSSKPRP